MPNGRLRGAIARMRWRSRHEMTASQVRRLENREQEAIVRAEIVVPDYEVEPRWSYEISRHTEEYWAEPAPFRTETGDRRMTEFVLIDEGSESEPWEFYNTWKTTEVTGALADAVRTRTGKSGKVTITERYDSWGTCEVCGGEEDWFAVSVEDEEVFRGETSVAPENITTFVAFTNWLGESK